MFRCVAILVVLLSIAPLKAAEPPKARPMQATAYCQSGTTASGTQTRRGIVAADPRVLPLGTTIRIVAPVRDYSTTYRVEDTGGKVKGRIVDIYVRSCAAARRFGRRMVHVHVLQRARVVPVADKD